MRTNKKSNEKLRRRSFFSLSCVGSDFEYSYSNRNSLGSHVWNILFKYCGHNKTAYKFLCKV